MLDATPNFNGFNTTTEPTIYLNIDKVDEVPEHCGVLIEDYTRLAKKINEIIDIISKQ